MHKTVAVIGHVDHGKTALVKALTGIDTDRLDEERKRGLSIVLGFANQQTPEGYLHLIDAPGHADFIQTAAMGLSSADTILLVIAANEGPSHQTVEHLKLAQLFGIRDAVVAISKSDLEDAHVIVQLSDTITGLLVEHGVNPRAVVACSSQSMSGIETLSRALRDQLALKRSRSSPNRIFLPIDRVFSAEGAGTVVTGTLIGGALSLDDLLSIQPEETSCSVRGIQIAGQAAESAAPGARVAVNLRGIKAQDVSKGDVLCPRGEGAPTRFFDVAVHPPASGTRPLSHMEEVTVLHGTSRSTARIRLLTDCERDVILGQLEFETNQIGFEGQRFVIRRPAMFETVCGGQILDAQAALAKRKKVPHIAVLKAAAHQDVLEIAKAISERDGGVVSLSLLARLARQTIEECLGALGPGFILGENGIAYSAARIDSLKNQLIETVGAFHKERPARPHASFPHVSTTFKQVPHALLDHALHSLIDERIFEPRLDGIAIVGYNPNEHLSVSERKIYQDAADQLRQSGLMPKLSLYPPTLSADRTDLIDLMVWNGEAVRLFNHALNQTVILHAEAVREAIICLQRSFPEEQAFKTGEARAALSTNRKTIVPLLEHLDAKGVTKRDGNVRVIIGAQTSN